MGSLIDLSQSLVDLKVSQYTELAAASIVIFEHLITLDDEIKLIWRSSWTPLKLLFLANRYYALAAVTFNTYGFIFASKMSNSLSVQALSEVVHSILTKPTNFQGKHYFRWQGWTELVTFALADGILQMRLYALYSLDKRILAVMVFCFALTIGVSGHILISIQSPVRTVVIPSPLGSGGAICYPLNVSSTFYVFWIPLIAFECLLCGLAVFRGLQTLRYSGSIGRRLLFILIRDSIVYFFGICITYAVCLIVAIVTPMSLLGLPIVFIIAMPCVLSNRMVLNIRAANESITSRSSPSIRSPIRFG